MPIYQINLWVCELCGSIESNNQEVSQYSDPIVEPPNGSDWKYIDINGKELLVCHLCELEQNDEKL